MHAEIAPLLATPESAMRLVDAAGAVARARYDALERTIAETKRSKISNISQSLIGMPPHSNRGFGDTPPRWKSAPGLTPTGKQRRRRIALAPPPRNPAGQPGNTNRLRHGPYRNTRRLLNAAVAAYCHACACLIAWNKLYLPPPKRRYIFDRVATIRAPDGTGLREDILYSRETVYEGRAPS